MGCVMENYKIKVNNEAESKEAQELFFALGAHWGQSKTASFNPDPMSFIYFNGSSIYYGHNDENDEDWFLSSSSGKELTLPQLRDLVVLNRGDGITDSTAVIQNAINPSINKPKDPALISGAEALRALVDGKEVEGFLEENEEWIPIVYFTVQEVVNGLYKFRLKPQTIKLELELPKPFEPKYGDWYWFVNTNSNIGYSRCQFYNDNDDKKYIKLGAWKTEDEIKQVVAALRGIKK